MIRFRPFIFGMSVSVCVPFSSALSVLSLLVFSIVLGLWLIDRASEEGYVAELWESHDTADGWGEIQSVLSPCVVPLFLCRHIYPNTTSAWREVRWGEREEQKGGGVRVIWIGTDELHCTTRHLHCTCPVYKHVSKINTSIHLADLVPMPLRRPKSSNKVNM